MPNQLYRLDRPLFPYERDDPPFPLPPVNVEVRSESVGRIDVRWDDPNLLLGNQKFNVVGVNVYRSFDTEHAGFERLNVTPIGGNFYRDETDNQMLLEENVTASLRRGSEHVDNRWFVKVQNKPIVQSTNATTTIAGTASVPLIATSPKDIELKIDGQIVPALRIYGQSGEIEMISSPLFDPIQKKLVPPVLPGPSSVITVTYRHNRNVLTNSRNQRIWYRLTTVHMNDDGSVQETPLEHVRSETPFETARLDYIWREAIRRNRWILEQGGERVRVFIRRWQGIPCTCVTNESGLCFNSEHHKHPTSDCLDCFGAGILGGYDGPFDMIISPRQVSREVRRVESGLRHSEMDTVWSSPSPLLNQRDFLVKMNNDRYSIGPVTVPSARGMILQQEFPIGLLPEGDIIYRVPMEGLTSLAFPLDQAHYNRHQGVMPTPTTTEKASVPNHNEHRGRTPVYENITH